MKKGRLINVMLVVVALGLVSVGAFSLRSEAAADRVTVLKTAGMTCGSCAHRVTQALEHEPGVASVAVDLEGGRVVVGYDSRRTGADAIAACVTRSGYDSSIRQVISAVDYRRLTGIDPARKPGSFRCGRGERDHETGGSKGASK